MAKKRKKTKSPAPAAPVQPAGPRRPWELIVIASFCIAIGGLMTFARSGGIKPVPADHIGDTPALANMDASQMRVYGVFTLLIGLGLGGLAGWQWKHPPKLDDDQV